MNRYSEKEVVVITLPKEKPEEVTRELALDMLGSVFTNIFISNASQKKPEIAGFSENAESCLKKTETWQNKTFAVKFCTLAAKSLHPLIS